MEKKRDITLSSGVNLHILHTKQFHSGYFSVSLLRPLKQEWASKDSLLMPVLNRGTRSLPDMQKISAALEELYGASVSPVITQYGETMSCGFQAFFPDDRFLPNEQNHLERVITLTGDMLLDPATRGGLLQEAYVRSERQNLHDRIQSSVNNKRTYARIRARSLMFEGEPFGIFPLGTAEEALKQNYLSLTKHYRQALTQAPVELYYCGGAEPDRVEDAVRKAFRAIPGSGERIAENDTPLPQTKEWAHITEIMDVEQGNLVLGFRFSGAGHLNGPATAVFNEMLGGGSSSRLFRNIREARSLCYSISSNAERYKNSLTVQAGIPFDAAEAVEEAVLSELKQIEAGDFSEEELDIARKGVFSSYRMGLDDPSAQCGFLLGQSLLSESGDLRQYAALSLEVKKEDVMLLASRVRPRLSYFLTKGEKA